jgi:Putative peptidoglycan binding domain
MSAPAQHAADEAVAIPPGGERRPKRRGRKLATVTAVILIAAGGTIAGILMSLHGRPAAPAAAADATSLAPVTRQSISSQTTVSGTMGYAGSYTVVVPAATGQPSGSGQADGGSSGAGAPSGGAAGTFTALPAVGQVVRQGQSLYAVSGSPVVLLYGSVPAYRTMSEGMSGTDVRQLNAALVALGDASRSELDPDSSYFSAATAAALDKLQSSLGLTQTGSLPLGQAVFVPTAAEISSVSATLGAPAQPGTSVLQATSTTRQVVAQVDTDQQSDVTPGAQVSVVLPDNSTSPGVVTSVSPVANSAPPGGGSGSSGSGSSSSSGSSGSAATVNVDIRLTDPAAAASTLDQAPVQVNITTATVRDALVVPIDALLAQPAGYAVEVAGAAGARHVVPVSLGLFDDAAGLVQVTGKGLAEGQQVVVPQI